MTNFSIRDAVANDISFIYDTWLNSYKHDSAVGKSIRSGIYYNEYRFVIDSILEHSKVSVACKVDEPNVIYGYLVSSPNVIHYIFVKDAFRRFDIATTLLASQFKQGEGVQYTHKTFMISDYIDKYPMLTYNPFLLYRTSNTDKESNNA